MVQSPVKSPVPQTAAPSPSCAAAVVVVKEKKKRTANPGVRQQGGRIYDSENGSTCHQCRQKTIETKGKCTACTLFFCPRCLQNRYNEVVEAVNALPNWSCPRCRGLCNCSNCRKKAGLHATGILANVAKTAGFVSVSELLQKNPQAQAVRVVQAKTTTTADADGSGAPTGLAKSQQQQHQQQQQPQRPKAAPGRKRKAREVVEIKPLVDDAELPARVIDFPTGADLALYKTPVGGGGDGGGGNGSGTAATVATAAIVTPGGSIKRLKGPAWLQTKVPDVVLIPADVDSAQLASVLEFIHVFGCTALGLRLAPSLTALGAEILQPPSVLRAEQLCPVPEDSVAAAVHVALLGVVQKACGGGGGGGCSTGAQVSLSTWQMVMLGYYAAEMISSEAAKVLRQEHGPPAAVSAAATGEEEQEATAVVVASGNVFSAFACGDKDDGDEDTSNIEGNPTAMVIEEETAAAVVTEKTISAPKSKTVMKSKCSVEEYTAAVAAAAAVDYPEGGYWGVSPALRVSMLYALVHDALDTYIVRDAIEQSMEMAAEVEKERKSEAAELRKAAREAAAKQRDQELAIMLVSAGAAPHGGGGDTTTTNGDTKSMTLEEQKSLMEEARKRVQETTTGAAGARLKALMQQREVPPTVRTAALGLDRDGVMVFQPQCAAVLTGSAQGVLTCSSSSQSSSSSSSIQAYALPAVLMNALDPQGKSEGALRQRLLPLVITTTTTTTTTEEENKKQNKYNSPVKSAKKKLELDGKARTPVCSPMKIAGGKCPAKKKSTGTTTPKAATATITTTTAIATVNSPSGGTARRGTKSPMKKTAASAITITPPTASTKTTTTTTTTTTTAKKNKSAKKEQSILKFLQKI